MVVSFAWSPIATVPVVAESELHVWRASLDWSGAILSRLENTLTTQEKKRAERFLVPHARDRFVVARGILRELMGPYLGLDADKAMLSDAPRGKPSLSTEHNSIILFSVPHSREMS